MARVKDTGNKAKPTGGAAMDKKSTKPTASDTIKVADSTIEDTTPIEAGKAKSDKPTKAKKAAIDKTPKDKPKGRASAPQEASDNGDLIEVQAEASNEVKSKRSRTTKVKVEVPIQSNGPVKKSIKNAWGKEYPAEVSAVLDTTESTSQAAVPTEEAPKKGRAKKTDTKAKDTTEKADAKKAPAPRKRKGKAQEPQGDEGKDLLTAAKDKAAGAFKKAEAVVVDELAKATSTKGKKRKAPEDSNTIKVDESAPAASAKKQKKASSAPATGIAGLTDRVTSFLSNVADNVVDGLIGSKASIDEDVAGVGSSAAGANLEEKKEGSKPKAKKGKTNAKAASKPAPSKTKVIDGADDFEGFDEAEEDEWEPDDQTANLISGFESNEEESESGDEGFIEGKQIPGLPTKKGLSKKLQAAKANPAGESGVIYIGRIPHGFHEHEMRSYFSQFGDVNHVRLSRSKKTGRSKHYAFLEFASVEVAKIAADTMNNYLLFGHILKCSVVPQEQVHANLWKGADRRFKTVPWAKIEGRKLNLPKGQSEWQKKVEKERKRRSAQAAKLKKIGYDFQPTELEDPKPAPKGKKKAIEEKPADPEEASSASKGKKKTIEEKPAEVESTSKGKKEATKEKPVAQKGRKASAGKPTTEKVKGVVKSKPAEEDKTIVVANSTEDGAGASELDIADTPAAAAKEGKRAKKPTKRGLEAMEELAGSKSTKKAKK